MAQAANAIKNDVAAAVNLPRIDMNPLSQRLGTPLLQFGYRRFVGFMKLR